MADDGVTDGEVELREEVLVRQTHQLQQGVARQVPPLGAAARLAAVQEVKEAGESPAGGVRQADGRPLGLREAAREHGGEDRTGVGNDLSVDFHCSPVITEQRQVLHLVAALLPPTLLVVLRLVTDHLAAADGDAEVGGQLGEAVHAVGEPLRVLPRLLQRVQQQVESVVTEQNVVQHLLLSDQQRGGDDDVLFLLLPDGRVDQSVADLSLPVSRLSQQRQVLLQRDEERLELRALTAEVERLKPEQQSGDVAGEKEGEQTVQVSGQPGSDSQWFVVWSASYLPNKLGVNEPKIKNKKLRQNNQQQPLKLS